MSTIKHLLFDNDGTIVDSEILAVRIMLRMLEPYGFKMSEQEYCHRFPGLVTRDIFSILQIEYGIVLSGDFLHTLHEEHIRSFDRELRAVPGMHRLFRSLKTPKSMVSNGSVRHVERSLRRVRLWHALDGHIFSAEHVPNPKPHPDIYIFALQKLGYAPSEVVAIEDSPTGVQSAKEAGVFTIGFLGATHIHDGHAEKLKYLGADLVVKNARELQTVLDRLHII